MIVSFQGQRSYAVEMQEYTGKRYFAVHTDASTSRIGSEVPGAFSHVKRRLRPWLISIFASVCVLLKNAVLK